MDTFFVTVILAGFWTAFVAVWLWPWQAGLQPGDLPALLWCLLAGPGYRRQFRYRLAARTAAAEPPAALLPAPCAGQCPEAGDLRRELDAVREQARLGAAAAWAREKHLREQAGARIVVEPVLSPNLDVYFAARPAETETSTVHVAQACLDTSSLDEACEELTQLVTVLDQSLGAISTAISRAYSVPPFVFSGWQSQ
jgi:hypothetical protein